MEEEKEQSTCPNGGEHKWYKPYVNEEVKRCAMCDRDNLCGKPHNNGEESCMECEIIKLGI